MPGNQQQKQKKNSKFAKLRVYRRAVSPLPKKFLDFFEQRLRLSGIREDVDVWLGKRILISFLFGLVLLTLYIILYNPPTRLDTLGISFGLFFGVFTLIFGFSYLKLYFNIADRTSHLEKNLPDFLLLMVSNLRAGLSPYESFNLAARPEFKVLYTEVQLSTAKASGSSSVSIALSEISNYFDSRIFERIVGLFIKGIQSGGRLATLLTSSAEEVRRIQDLRAELTTSTRTYMIFLGFIIVVIMPFLLSVSTQFLTIFLQMQVENPGVDTASFGNVPTFSGKISITGDEMVMISIATLILTSALVSNLIGIITKGKALYGLKYFPLFAIASIVFYLLAKIAIGGILSNFGGV